MLWKKVRSSTGSTRSSMDSDLSSAETSLQRAKESAQTAQSDYAEETARIAGNTYRSTASGYIKTLYIKEGDKVNNGTKIADLYDDSVMKITVPFLSGEAAEINVGDEAAVISGGHRRADLRNRHGCQQHGGNTFRRTPRKERDGRGIKSRRTHDRHRGIRDR